MSTAPPVPETWGLTGDDARKTLADTGRLQLLKDSFARLRRADGTSHSRSLAFVMSLVLVQGLIVVVGAAAAIGSDSFSNVVVDTTEGAAPGPAGSLVADAVKQARSVGASDRYLILLIGLSGLLVTATTTMGQLERGLNRIYGVEQDRPFRQKYARAFLLAISAGLAIALAFGILSFGRKYDGSGAINAIWAILRWPLGVSLVAVGLAVLFRWAPNRRQPGRSWLAFGSSIALVLWTITTTLLALFFSVSSSFGDTYGPLAGIVALQLWTLFSALSIFYGAAVTAQLEAVRAGAVEPRRAEDQIEASRVPAGAAG